MSLRKYQQTIISALQQHRGDDAHRARAAFAGLSPAAMQEYHGWSGRTRAEILAQYEDHERRCTEAIKWINSLS